MRGGGGRANRSSRYCMHSADLEEGGSKGAKSVVLAAVCIEKCNVFEVEETLEFFFSVLTLKNVYILVTN